jgi:hypothetical protein
VPEERDEKYWRERADEIVALAGILKTSELKAELLIIADRYERLAERTSGRSSRSKKLGSDEQANC